MMLCFDNHEYSKITGSISEKICPDRSALYSEQNLNAEFNKKAPHPCEAFG